MDNEEEQKKHLSKILEKENKIREYEEFELLQ